MPWFPNDVGYLRLQGPYTTGNVLASGPQIGQAQDAGFAGITGPTALNAGVQVYLPVIGNPHVANQVYLTNAGVWMVSTG